MTFVLGLAEQITRELDEIIEDVCPGVGRRPMYGGIVFEKQAGKHDTMVCGRFVYKQHVSLEFSRGTEMDDPDGILEGKGKYRRHIKLVDPADIRDKSVRSYVEQAFSLV
jgi:hypothetical protein